MDELEDFEGETQERIRRKIEGLTNPFQANRKKIRGRENTYRIRVGDYRILYSIYPDDETVVVANIAHRKRSYN